MDDYQKCLSVEPMHYCKHCISLRTDSDRYTELRALVEAWQSGIVNRKHTEAKALATLAKWEHR